MVHIFIPSNVNMNALYISLQWHSLQSITSIIDMAFHLH